jgi:hypothetical protein
MRVWVCFDLDNAHGKAFRYGWVFPTRASALAHRKRQHALNYGARLSMPVRFEGALPRSLMCRLHVP